MTSAWANINFTYLEVYTERNLPSIRQTMDSWHSSQVLDSENNLQNL